MAYFSLLKHQFKVSHVPYEARTDTLLNIKKRRESVIYSGTTNTDNVNLAFASTESINSNNNLFISDHSTRLPANRIDNTDPVVFIGNTFTLDVDTFLLTDVFTTQTPTQPTVPLFRQHLISRDRYNPDDATQAILSLEILDTDLNVIDDLTELLVSTTDYRDLSYGVVFNNLENEFDSDTNEPVVYYIKYTVRVGSVINNYVELLNNIPVYRQASFDDVDEFGVLLSTRKVYNISESVGGTFEIDISSVSTKHALIQQLVSRISLLKPPVRSNEDPWYLNISNGKFFATVNAIVQKYEIAEFEDQLFTPFLPYKTITRETGITFGDSSLVKASKSNIIVDADQDFHVLVELEDRDSNVVKAFTTDGTKIGTSFAPGVQFEAGIRSVSGTDGFIDLVDEIPADHSAVLSYVYEEKEYEFTEVDFNPVNNKEVDKEVTVLYIVPQTTERDRTLFYIRVNQRDEVLFSSQADYADTVGLEIAARLASSSGLLYSAPAGFIDSYTVESQTGNPNQYLVLGEVYVGEATSVGSTDIIDIRTRGGGLKESLGSDILQRNLESQWNWDMGYWDGYPYPSMGSFVVEVPCELLDSNGGNLTRTQIQGIVQEHAAAGSYGVVRTYSDASPQFTDIVVGSGVIDLEWTDSGPSVTYNVYQAQVEEGPYTLLTDPALAVNSLTVSGLSNATTYWFKVTGIKDGDECVDASDISIIGAQTR